MKFYGLNCTNINKEDITIGTNFKIEGRIQLIGVGPDPKSFVFGDNVYIGEDVKIIGNNVKILDYTKLHNHCFIYAPEPLSIGFNCWIGQNTILNAEATLLIKNNVCISAYSQLWTHIKFGDTLEGCRFNSYHEMTIEDDVWFGGNCIVTPIVAQKKSMVLAGSVVTKDLKENRIYAGSPAVDITEKMGYQFDNISLVTKLSKMNEYLKIFLTNINNKSENTIEIVLDYPEELNPHISYFNVRKRTYTKRNSKIEQEFMNFLLPEKAKFIPREAK